MKVLFAFLLTLTAGSASAAKVEISSATLTDPYQLVGSTSAYEDGAMNLTSFPERLVFEVSWGLLSVGEATLGVERVVRFGGTPAYHIVSEAVSNGFCDTFYKVRDLNESWLDAKTMTSLGYSKKLREGGFFRNEWVVYDKPEKRFLSRTTNRDGTFSYASGPIPPSVQDVLSSVFFLRTQKLVPGTEVVMDVNTKQTWPLVVRVVRKEKIRTPAGKFDTILVEPAMRQEGIFIQKGKKLQIWLTDDALKMPVLMKVEVFFGHVTAKLAKML